MKRPCLRIIDGTPCGLWNDHDGDHTPHEIGAYLDAPLLTPLHLLPRQINGQRLHHCPLCGTTLTGWMEGHETAVFYMDATRDHPARIEHWLDFWPCGCPGRQLHYPLATRTPEHGHDQTRE